MIPLHLVSFAVVFVFFQNTNAYVNKNVTVDRAVDQMLLKIESAVKHRNLTEFESFFSPKFDSESWFDRYYSELSESQLASFVLRRFGHVDARGLDYKFKFSESHNLTNQLLLRSFIAWTKGTPINMFAIQTIRYYGEY
uniref:RxLR effector protein n=1 Tax=Caenorhabditis tropicalis TaxID=1561998 RepID=A0A1I7T071_9PELO